MKKINMEIVQQIEDYEPSEYLGPEDARRLQALYDAAPHLRVLLGLGEAPTFAISYSHAIEEALALPDNERIQVPYTYYSRLLDEADKLTARANAAFAEALRESPDEVLKALQREASRIIKEARVPVENQAKGLGLTQEKAKDLTERPPEEPPDMPFDAPEYGEYLGRRFFSDVFADNVLRGKITFASAHLILALEAAGGEWPERGRAAIDSVIARKWTVRAPRPIQGRPKPPRLPSPNAEICHSNHKPADAVFYGPEHRELIDKGVVTFSARKGKETFSNSFKIIDAVKAACIAPEDRPVYDALEEIVISTVLEHGWLEHMYPLPEAVRIPIGRIFRRESWSANRRIDKDQFARICASLRRIKGTEAVLDCTEEAQAWGFKNALRMSHLIEGEIVLLGDQRGADAVLEITAVPLLARYALQTGKYFVIDTRFVYRNVPMQSPGLRAARNYLLRRIEDGYTYGNRTLTVQIADITEAAGIDPSNKDKMMRLRKGIERQLQAWAAPDTADKSELQFIERAAPHKQGRTVTGYQIVLLDRPKEAFTLQGIEAPETWQGKKLSSPKLRKK